MLHMWQKSRSQLDRPARVKAHPAKLRLAVFSSAGAGVLGIAVVAVLAIIVRSGCNATCKGTTLVSRLIEISALNREKSGVRPKECTRV